MCVFILKWWILWLCYTHWNPSSSCLTESGWPGATLYSWQSRLSEIWFLCTTHYDNLQRCNNRTARRVALWLHKIVWACLWFPFLSTWLFWVVSLWDRNVLTAFFFFCFFLLGENQRDEGLALHHLKNTASPESKYKILLTLITLFFV